MDLEKIMRKYTDSPDLRKIKAFDMVESQHLKPAEVTNRLNISYKTLLSWRKEVWWTEASELLIKEAYKDGKRKIIKKVSENVDGILDNIFFGSDVNKTANAQASLIKMFAESTDDPLVQKNNKELSVNIDNRSISFGSIDMEKVRNAPAHIKKEIALGNIPQEYRKEG